MTSSDRSSPLCPVRVEAMERRRVLAQVKINLGAPASSLLFAVDALDGGIPRTAWLGESRRSADDLVRGDFVPGKPIQSEAERFWLDLLADGPIAAREVMQRAGEAGFSQPTLERARKAIGVQFRKAGMGGGWEWLLPEDPHVPGNEGLRLPGNPLRTGGRR
jgi:hypothetical protein